MSANWVRVASKDDLQEGVVLAVEVNGEPVALCDLGGGEICAMSNICTHEVACLSDGWLEDGVIECPSHAGRFDVRTGKGLGPPIECDLPVYPARVGGGDIFVDAGAVAMRRHGFAGRIILIGEVAAFWHPMRGVRLLLETWQHAQNHGVAVGRAMAGDPQPYAEIPWFWSDQQGVNVQVAGFPADGAQAVTRPGAAGAFTTFYLDEAGRVTGAVGFDSPREVRGAQALIQRAQPVDAERLADPATPIQRLLARQKAAAA